MTALQHPRGREQRKGDRHIPAPVACAVWIFGRLTLFLLPAVFRREYGRAIAQDFSRDCRDTYATAGGRGLLRLAIGATADLVQGAVAEYRQVVTYYWKGILAMPRLRSALLTIFCAWVAFVIAGLGLQKMTEYDDFQSVAAHQLTVGLPFKVVYVGAAVSLLAVLIGGVPLAAAALRQALADRRFAIAALFAVPPLALALFVGFIILYTRDLPQSAASGHIHVVVGAFVVAAILSTAAVCYAVSATSPEISAVIGFAKWPAAITAATMVLMGAATIIVALRLNAVAPGVVGDMTSYYTFTLLNVTVLMALAAIVAAIGAARLFIGRPQAAAPA
jgi:hypothetical protein